MCRGQVGELEGKSINIKQGGAPGGLELGILCPQGSCNTLLNLSFLVRGLTLAVHLGCPHLLHNVQQHLHIRNSIGPRMQILRQPRSKLPIFRLQSG